MAFVVFYDPSAFTPALPAHRIEAQGREGC